MPGSDDLTIVRSRDLQVSAADVPSTNGFPQVIRSHISFNANVPGLKLGMDIIPVIDLRHGLAVRATGGNRADYKPIVTPLSPSAEPVAVIEGFLNLFPFETFYIADLDALEGRRIQWETLSRLRQIFPSIEFWIDCGLKTKADLEHLSKKRLGRAVLASETFVEDALSGDTEAILSLDFKHGKFLGWPEILSRPDLWPEQLIIMSLDSVGSASGPNLDQLSKIRAATPLSRIYAAGGVRNLRDLLALRDIGLSGALVSSALHSGALTRADLDSLGTLKRRAF